MAWHHQAVDSDGYDDEWATCSRTYAGLRIFSTELDPDAVNRSLGVEASHSHVTGDPVGRMGGRRKSGAWILSTEDRVTSKDLKRHVDWLLDAIEPKAEAFTALIGAGAMADIFCYWESRSGHGGPDLSPRQMARLVRLNLSLGLDVYFPEVSEA
jgi:Domain of unknown function (DUF4279)